jgi:zinc protease
MYPIKLKFTVLAAILVFLFSAASNINLAHAVKIKEIKTPDGLTAWLVRDHTNPIISIHFRFKGGSALDPNGKEGLAGAVSALLDEGAGKWSSSAFQRQMEDLSVKLSFNTNRDSFGGRLQTLRKNRTAAFNLLKAALTKPRLDEEPVSRIRGQILANLRQRSEDPGTVASQALMKALFPTHPYGRPSSGTIKSVKSITRSDLTTFVKQRLAQNNLIVGVVGDISKEEVTELLSKVFGGLPKKASPWNLPEVIPTAEGKTIVVNKPVPQSSIMFAHQGFKLSIIYLGQEALRLGYIKTSVRNAA